MLNDNNKPTLVIITGLSGAGRSTCIKVLEDLGFCCIDLLPIELLETTTNYLIKDPTKNYCIGLDIKDEESILKLKTYKKELSNNFNIDLIYLTASESVLLSRYSETRRKHPLIEKSGNLSSAILKEINDTSLLSSIADICLDTSYWSPHYLSRVIEERYLSFGVKRYLYLTVSSFGFKYGNLSPAENIIDVRFLNNPYFVPELKNKTGLDKDVKDYVFKDERTSIFLDKLIDMYSFLLPSYYKEGKNFLRIGVGCTGGKHRSVCLAEEIGFRISNLNIPNILVSINHRDLFYKEIK